MDRRFTAPKCRPGSPQKSFLYAAVTRMEVPCRQSVRGSKPSDSLSLTVAQRLSRLFDLVTALAGIAALIALGPWMLINAATAPVPEAGDLMQLDGITVTCRPTVGGAELRLAGYAREFHSLLDSCERAVAQPGHPARVSLHVVRSDLNARQRRPSPVLASSSKARSSTC
jgi:hypothetical protein